MKFEEQLLRHWQRSVPIILIDGAIDELATGRQVLESTKESYDIQYIWTCSSGLETTSISRQYAEADKYLKAAEADPNIGPYTTNPETALRALVSIMMQAEDSGKEWSIGTIMYMGDRVLSRDNPDRFVATQLLMDLRDRLKVNKACVYMIGLDFDIPPELKEHIVILNAPMPQKDDYLDMVNEVNTMLLSTAPDTKFKLTNELKEQYVSILRGASSFSAEQMLYLATDNTGISSEILKERAIQTINSTRGLSVYKGDGRGFSAIGGLDGIKEYTKSLVDGRLDIKCIVYADEVEKTLAGSTGSNAHSVDSNILGTWLSEYQDTNALGMIFTGIYGCAKSEFAKRLGEECDAITINFDVAGTKDSLVGNSEANARRAFQVIREIGGTEGGILYIATSNRIASLPPEFRRRFNLGTFFFYFPNEPERDAIWPIYCTQWGLELPDFRKNRWDENWTGAEIQSCCRLAYLRKCSIEEASRYIVPVHTTAKEDIEKLVDQANGRFLDASAGSVFTKPFRSTASKSRKSTFNA